MKLKTDKLAVSVYYRHGDTCSLSPHCKSLGCASGHEPDDLVLSARFAYLQEAIDYAQSLTKRGVCCRLVSRILPSAPYVSNYAPAPKEVPGNHSECGPDCVITGDRCDGSHADAQ